MPTAAKIPVRHALAWMLVLPVTAQAPKPKEAGADLDELLTTQVLIASKRLEGVLDAPASLYVISGAEMHRRGYKSLFDLLQDVPGVLNYPHQDGEMFMGTPAVRGTFLPRRLKLMFNGMTLDPKDGSGLTWTDRFPIEGIERVEVILGPYASMYGRNTFSGVINVILKTGEQVQGAEASLLLGSDRQIQGTVLAGSTFGKADLFFSYFKNRADGVDLARDYPEYYSVASRLRDGARFAPGASADYVFPWNHDDFLFVLRHESGLEVNLHANLAQLGKNPTFSPLVYACPEESKITEDLLNGRAKYAWKPGEKWTLTSSVAWQDYRWKGLNDYLYVQFPSGSGQFAPTKKFYTRSARTTSLAQDFWYEAATGHAVFLGLSFDQVDLRPFTATPHELAPAPVWGESQKNTYFNATLQYEWQMTSAFKGVAGVMWEHSNAYGKDVLLPRLAVVARPREETSIKFVYSQGFLTPSTEAQADQITPGADNLKGTRGLMPEFITSYELSATQMLGAYAHITLSLFRNKIEDIVQRVKDPTLPAPYSSIYKNLGTSASYGADLAFEARLAPRLRTFLAYSYVAGDYDQVNADNSLTRVKRLPMSAGHLAKAGIQIPLGEFLDLYVHDYFVGPRATTRETRNGGYTGTGGYPFATPWYELGGYNLLDFHLSTTPSFHRALRLSAGITNLLDRKAFDPPYVEATIATGLVPIRRRAWYVQAGWTW